MTASGVRVLVLGAQGQLGRALRAEYPGAEYATRAQLDLTRPDLEGARAWHEYRLIINAAAYTRVDDAETPSGRRDAWAANVTGVAALARIAVRYSVLLVHVSSDYVFDGSLVVHDEQEPFTPLNVYGQTKAAGDAAVSVVPEHYVIRTSWVIGHGNNFVRSMAALAARGVDPQVVNDQVGRLSFTTEIARGIRHLDESGAPYGTYNISNTGEPLTWADIAREVFRTLGYSPARVDGISTAAYFAGTSAAPRPRHSTLALDRVVQTGFTPRDQLDMLRAYVRTR